MADVARVFSASGERWTRYRARRVCVRVNAELRGTLLVNLPTATGQARWYVTRGNLEKAFPGLVSRSNAASVPDQSVARVVRRHSAKLSELADDVAEVRSMVRGESESTPKLTARVHQIESMLKLLLQQTERLNSAVFPIAAPSRH